MTSSASVDTENSAPTRVRRQLVVVAGLGLLLGAATSFAQGLLPDALCPPSPTPHRDGHC